MNLKSAFYSRFAPFGSLAQQVNRTCLSSLCIAAFASSLFAADPPLPPGAKPKKEADTGAGEGPVWHPSGDLYFTGGNRITRRDSKGVTHVFREPSGGANGLLFDFQGRLVVCEAGRRRVTRTEPDGAVTLLADNYRGKRFNSPNDLTIDSKGRIYFTDPRYGSRDDMEIRDDRAELVEGVYRIDGIGEVSQITAHEVNRPNGILVSPQDRYLYVADNNNNVIGGARKLWRFDLKANGTVDPNSRKLIFDWETGRGPDGFEMDQAGRLYVAGGLNVANPPYESIEKFKGGIYILSPEGKLLDFVPIPKDEVTNCTFGGADLKTLFITAGGTLWSIPVNTPGRLPFIGK
jgi:gluconolactonase